MKELKERIMNATTVLIFGIIVIPFGVVWLTSMIFVGILDALNDDDVISLVYDFGLKILTRIAKTFGGDIEDEDF